MAKKIIEESYIIDYAKQISLKIKSYIDSSKITQKQIVKNCESKGLFISQGTISHALNEPESMTFATLIKICTGLNIELEDLFVEKKHQNFLYSQDNNLFMESDLLIQDPSNSAFQGYLGTFFTYFHQTKDKDKDNIIEGRITFEPTEDNTKCKATFFLPTGQVKMVNGKKIETIKKYSGQLIISISMRSAYCILSSENEICFFIFSHFHIITENLRCTMANAVTTSAGSNRRPTCHRICLSDRKIEGDNLNYIKGQLLLNNSDILISVSKLEELKKSKVLSPEILEVLEGAIQKEKYYSISESKLIGNNIAEDVVAKDISILRTYSTADKYNKVSAKTNELLFSIIDNIEQK